MQVRLIHSDDYSAKDIQDITTMFRSNPDSSGNYDVDDWESKNYTFLHVFMKTDRFSKTNGGVVLLYDQNQLCGVSGYNRSSLHPDVFILGARTLIAKDYRHKLLMSSYFIPEQITKVQGIAKMAVFLFDKKNTFNLYDVFVNGKLNAFLKNKYQDFAYIWDNLKAVAFPVVVFKGDVHNALYITLDQSFHFEWEKIRHTDV